MLKKIILIFTLFLVSNLNSQTQNDNKNYNKKTKFNINNLKAETKDFLLEKPDQNFSLSNGLQVITKKREGDSHLTIQIGFKNFDCLLIDKENLYISVLLLALLPYYNISLKNFLQASINSSYQIDLDQNKILFKTPSCNLVELLTILDKAFGKINIPNYFTLKAVLNNICSILERDFYNNLNYYTAQEKNSNIYKDYPWTINNSQLLEMIKNINKDKLNNFIQNYLVPNNCFLIIIGDFEQDNIKNILEKSFSYWKYKDINYNPIIIPEINNTKGQTLNRYFYTKNSNSLNLIFTRLSDYSNSQDHKILELIEDYLKTKIVELRYSTGLFYSLSSCLVNNNNFHNYLIKDYICIQLYSNLDNYIKLEDKLKNLLNNLCNQKISQENLDILKQSILIKYNKMLDSDHDYAQAYSLIISRNLDWDYFDNRVKDIQNISLEQVNQVIQKYFNPETWTIIRVGQIKVGQI